MGASGTEKACHLEGRRSHLVSARLGDAPRGRGAHYTQDDAQLVLLDLTPCAGGSLCSVPTAHRGCHAAIDGGLGMRDKVRYQLELVSTELAFGNSPKESPSDT